MNIFQLLLMLNNMYYKTLYCTALFYHLQCFSNLYSSASLRAE